MLVIVSLTAIPTTLACGCTVYVDRGGDYGRCPAGHDQDRPDHLRR